MDEGLTDVFADVGEGVGGETEEGLDKGVEVCKEGLGTDKGELVETGEGVGPDFGTRGFAVLYEFRDHEVERSLAVEFCSIQLFIRVFADFL